MIGGGGGERWFRAIGLPRGYYGGKWRLLEARVDVGRIILPRGFRSWLHFLWGFDLFFGKVPFVKALLVANAAAWWLIWAVRP